MTTTPITTSQAAQVDTAFSAWLVTHLDEQMALASAMHEALLVEYEVLCSSQLHEGALQRCAQDKVRLMNQLEKAVIARRAQLQMRGFDSVQELINALSVQARRESPWLKLWQDFEHLIGTIAAQGEQNKQLVTILAEQTRQALHVLRDLSTSAPKQATYGKKGVLQLTDSPSGQLLGMG